MPQRAAASRSAHERSEARTVAPSDASTLGPELALLERVQAELREGNGAQALRLLDESSLEVERSQLRAERLAAEVFAACQAGNVARAQRVMNLFLHDYPNSPTTARVRASCAGAESAE